VLLLLNARIRQLKQRAAVAEAHAVEEEDVELSEP
jgi:hypothetical protein